MTKALAKELGPTILVNAICPGVIETELGNTLTRERGAAWRRPVSRFNAWESPTMWPNSCCS